MKLSGIRVNTKAGLIWVHCLLMAKLTALPGARTRINRGYYTAARRYDFYLRVVKTIFYERAQRVSKILFLTREDKSHIFKPPYNVLSVQKQIGKSHVIDIFTSEDMENISLYIFQYLTLYYIIIRVIVKFNDNMIYRY